MQVSATQSLSSTTVSQQVEAFLGSVDPALANNAYLKLLIAALIMQVLLGEDGGAQKSSAGLQGLEALAGGRNNSLFVAMETSTNTVQIAQQSTRLDVTSAVQSMSETGGEDTGAQMDVTG
jgi:phospholipase/lecithinase/hemolysin